MSSLRIEKVEASTEDAWREIHNEIIPASPLSAGEVSERRQRHLLTLAYAGDELAGNATIRPPAPDADAATVIVRILPNLRNQGYGSEYLAAMLTEARRLGARRIETVVLTANAQGLRFAEKQGFVEFDRYEVDGAEYVDLVLSEAPG